MFVVSLSCLEAVVKHVIFLLVYILVFLLGYFGARVLDTSFILSNLKPIVYRPKSKTIYY